MLIVLVVFLIIVSVIVVIAKRNRETFFISGMCLSLATMLLGILIYIAKKGGISRELNEFFFLSMNIKTKIQYMLILLDQLGYIIALGRYLFPLFLMLMALHYCMIPWIRKNHHILQKVVFLLPIGTLIIYFPPIYRIITLRNNTAQTAIVVGTKVWIICYIAVAIILILYEACSIQMSLFRRQFILINAFNIPLSILYLLYFGQDPAQVYQFYLDNYVWKQGIYYMNATLSIPSYLAVLAANIIFAILGIFSLFRYASTSFVSNREEIIKQRKFKMVSNSASVFVHSIKNQLLSNRVLYKRLDLLFQEEVPDTHKMKEYIEALNGNNEFMLARLDELYRSVKSNAVHLVPVQTTQLIQGAIKLFKKKYPENQPKVKLIDTSIVLADETHLCEAIYNLLINAQEAIIDGNRGEEGSVTILCYNVRLYTVIEVVDNGIGINQQIMKKIFDPFYSSKNSNYNWGMGLQYVRDIVKEHYGTLRCESKEGEGSHFYILLPRYKD